MEEKEGWVCVCVVGEGGARGHLEDGAAPASTQNAPCKPIPDS